MSFEQAAVGLPDSGPVGGEGVRLLAVVFPEKEIEPVAKFSILVGLCLIGLALVAWSGVDSNFVSPAAGQASAAASPEGPGKKKSITALIPAFVGFPVLILGTLALQTSWRKNAMHGVAAIALLGAAAGLGRGLSRIGGLFSATDYQAMRPVLFSLLMGLFCLVLLFACIQSFVAARRLRQSASA